MKPDLKEEIKNYLIHSDTLCYVIKNTFEQILVNEEDCHLNKEVKKQIKKIGFEKMLLEADASLAVSKGKL